MNDDMLRESLARATGAEPPVGDAWTRFESKRRATAIWRNATVAAATIVAAVALITTLPGLTPRDAAELVGPGSGTPNAYATWPRYVDPVAQLEFRYAPHWTTGAGNAEGSGGDVDLYPRERMQQPFGHGDGAYTVEYPELMEVRVSLSAQSGTRSCDQFRAAHPERFSSEYLAQGHREPCRDDSDPSFAATGDALRRAGASVQEDVVPVSGREATRYVIRYPKEPTSPDVDSWCPGCEVRAYVVDWFDGWTLTIRMVSPDAGEFTKHIDAAEAIVQTLERFEPAR